MQISASVATTGLAAYQRCGASTVSAAQQGENTFANHVTAADSEELFTSFDADGDGAVSKDEFSQAIGALLEQLQGQLQQGRFGSAGGPPPPPPGGEEDQGFTVEELGQMASDGNMDTRHASLFSALEENFSTADADGNGRLTRSEAMAYRSTYLEQSAGSSISLAA